MMDNITNSSSTITDSIADENQTRLSDDNIEEDFENEKIIRKFRLDNDLAQLRHKKHSEYMIHKSFENHTIDRGISFSKPVTHSGRKKSNSSSNIWPKNTMLIASDSIMSGLNEKRLQKDINVKVRCFPGSSITDMHSYLIPLLAKEPDFILLHVGTNDCTNKSAETILDELLHLKHFINQSLPNATIIISQPIIRTDNSKAMSTITTLNKMLNSLKLYILDNSNIEEKHLSNRGLHLNDYGTKRMALNIITLLKNL